MAARAASPTLPHAAHMHAEIEEGNIEYKYKLTNLSEEQLAHRITQLNWRLNEGNNEAIYKIGVRDDGYPVGLSQEDLEESLATLRAMSATLDCVMTVTRLLRGSIGTVAEVHFHRRESSVLAPEQLDVCLAGESDAGKSTLIGVLVTGALDNGRGSARVQICKHNHELSCGRTSSISHHLLFLGHDGQALKSNSLSAAGMNGAELLRFSVVEGADPLAIGALPESAGSLCVENGAPAEIVTTAVNVSRARSTDAANASRLRAMSEEDVLRRTLRSVSFIDLAGHERYLKTTMHGLVGRAPQFCLLTVSAVAGARSGDYIGNVAREHLALASAMKLELFIVLTKTDLVPNEAALKPALLACANVLRACCIEGVVVRTAEELHLLLQSQTTRNEADLIHKPMKKSPIFVVSCVTGIGLSLLKKYLFCVRGPSSNQHIASLPAVENPKSAEQRSGHLILILDQYRIDQPVIDGAEFRPIGTAQSAECSAPASIVSPSAALKQLSLKDSRSADEELRESSLNSTLILFGSVQSGTVNVGDMLLYGPGSSGEFCHVVVTSIHVNRVPLRAVSSGRCACFAVKGVSSLSLASCTDCSNKSLTDASAENSDYPLEIINLAALKSNLNVLENSSFNSNGSKIGSKLREELRICHDNDPRRRKLRVDDPEHPSNQIIRPGAALTVKPSTRKKSSPPGTSTGGVDYVSDFIKDSPLSWTFRPGMVLLSPMSHPVACIEFFANILVLNHPKCISVNYEPVIHGLGIKQCAKILSIEKQVGGKISGDAEYLRNGDKAVCRFRFLYRPEFLPVGTNIVLREGRTRAIGIVTFVPP